LKSDLFEVLLAATSEGLEQLEMEWDRRVALGVVMAAAGYPMNPRKGDVITGLPKDQDEAMVFHAGTIEKDAQILTSGGRVLCVTVLADSVKQAQQKAYQTVSPISFDGMQMRQDIGYRAIKN
jgi:phosphoribosylamine--glycine ligase